MRSNSASRSRDHGFADGNKRTGLIVLSAFLELNGFRLDAPDDTLLGRILEAVLTHDMLEPEFAEHIAAYVSEVED